MSRLCYCPDQQTHMRTTTVPHIMDRNRALAARRYQVYRAALFQVYVLFLLRLLPWVWPISLAVSHLQTVHKTRVSFSGSTTAAITYSSGSLVVVTEACFSTTVAELTLADGGTHTYTVANSASGDASSHVIIRYAENTTAGARTLTWTETGAGNTDLEADVIEFAGAETSGALDVAPAAATGTSATPAIASGTLAQADEVIVAMGSHTGADATWSFDGTYTGVSQNDDNDAGQTYATEYKIVASTSSDTADFGLSASRDWFCTLASFKASGGGGGGSSAVVIRLLASMGMGR
jgi:hypothetical protein